MIRAGAERQGVGSRPLRWLLLLSLSTLTSMEAAADSSDGPGATPPVERFSGGSCSRLPLSAVGEEVEPRVRSAANRLLRVAAERYAQGVHENDPWALQRALDALDLAFALRRSPQLVLNMAQVQRHRERCAEARCLYEAYLGMPNSPEGRSLATHHINQMPECTSQPASDSLLGDRLRLWRSPPSRAARAAAPVELSLADSSSSRSVQASPRWTPRVLAVGAGLATGWAAVDYGRALRADQDASRLSPDSQHLSALQADGRARLRRAAVAGTASLVLAVSAAISYWRATPEGAAGEPSGPLRVEPLSSPSLGADLGVSLSGSF